ncbi:MAG: D-glycero-alpha-D-manno-heptose-1,7-bisphosphate 7-phosphatase [Limnochordia bacterium]
MGIQAKQSILQHKQPSQYRRAAFLDLQGTLGGEGLDDVRHFSFYPCAADAVRLLNRSPFLAIVITNQSHISKGLLTYGEYEQRMRDIRSSLARRGAYFDAVYCCPHDKDDGCKCKKPLPGMIDQAAQEFSICVGQSYIIGDMGAADMLLAEACGAKGILVLTGVGQGSLGEFRHTWAGVEPAYVAPDVLGAVRWILRQETPHVGV